MATESEARMAAARTAAESMGDELLAGAFQRRMEAARRMRESAAALEIEALCFLQERVERVNRASGREDGGRSSGRFVGSTSEAPPPAFGHAYHDDPPIERPPSSSPEVGGGHAIGRVPLASSRR